jgi:DNA-binding transcriptional LysR family regulator
MTRVDDRRLFVTVAEENSFSGAARLLGVPVSTVSRRIAVLESELGVLLFERTSRHVRLTDIGHDYLEQLRPFLFGIDDLEDGLARGQRDDAGTLRLAVPAGLQRPFFSSAIAELRQQFPNLAVSLLQSSRGMHPIRDGVDVVVAEQPPTDRDLVALKLLDTDDVCVASSTYLAQAGRPSLASELAEHSTLVLETSRTVPRWPLVQGGSVPVHPFLRCNDYGVLLDGVCDALGIALLPRLLVWATQQTKLETVLDGVVGQKRRFYLVYQRYARRRPLIGAFLDFAPGLVRSVEAQARKAAEEG